MTFSLSEEVIRAVYLLYRWTKPAFLANSSRWVRKNDVEAVVLVNAFLR
jgi:hypothetical protein